MLVPPGFYFVGKKILAQFHFYMLNTECLMRNGAVYRANPKGLYDRPVVSRILRHFQVCKSKEKQARGGPGLTRWG